MTSGIYSITNLEDGKRYIGRAVNTDKRWKYHQWMLNNDRHFNPHLQRAWHRGDKFEFSIVEECPKEFLNEREIYWIAYFNATDMQYGYNLCNGGGTTTGRKCSEESKRKMSEKQKGHKWSADVVKRRTDSLRKHMEEDSEFAEYIKSHRFYKGRNKGMHPANYGKKASLEARMKQSQSLKGKKKPKSQGEKLRALWSGEKSLTAKLKEKDVVQMRLRFLSGERQCDIHKDYPQITTQTLYDIVRNRRWKSVPNTIEELEEMEKRYGD